MRPSKLIDKKTRREIKTGDKVTDFRGIRWTLEGFTPPVSTNSTGRVFLQDADGEISQFYPGVIDAMIIDDQDDT
jgi:hypothetical protein